MAPPSRFERTPSNLEHGTADSRRPTAGTAGNGKERGADEELKMKDDEPAVTQSSPPPRTTYHGAVADQAMGTRTVASLAASFLAAKARSA